MNENPNNQTIKTYQENFDKYQNRTVNVVDGEFKLWIDSFCSKLPDKAKIFEIGSATGRDAKYFKSQGFDILCTDVIPEALDKLNQEGFKTEYFDFRDKPKEEWLNNFDGFFANAVLLHAPQDIFEEALLNIHNILKSNGVVAFSLKTGQGEEISNEKMDAPRYFKYYSKLELEEILNKFEFNIVSINPADNNKWLHIILIKK